MSEVEKEALRNNLEYLHTDFLMLREGSWEPDDESVDSSLTTLEAIHRLLGLSDHFEKTRDDYESNSL